MGKGRHQTQDLAQPTWHSCGKRRTAGEHRVCGCLGATSCCYSSKQAQSSPAAPAAAVRVVATPVAAATAAIAATTGRQAVYRGQQGASAGASGARPGWRSQRAQLSTHTLAVCSHNHKQRLAGILTRRRRHNHGHSCKVGAGEGTCRATGQQGPTDALLGAAQAKRRHKPPASVFHNCTSKSHIHVCAASHPPPP